MLMEGRWRRNEMKERQKLNKNIVVKNVTNNTIMFLYTTKALKEFHSIFNIRQK